MKFHSARKGKNIALRRSRGLYFVPALVAAVTIALFAGYADWQRGESLDSAQRAAVAERLLLEKTRLDALISRNVAILQGLIGDLPGHMAEGSGATTKLLSNVLRNAPQIRNIAIAPDLKVTMVYPLEGNESVIGLDYTHNIDQMAAVMTVKKSGKVMVTGPVNLVQGGKGLIARYPVVVRSEDGTEKFWGIVSSVMDVERLFRDSGWRISDPDLRIAMRVKSRNGEPNAPFFGDPAVLEKQPVTDRLELGYDTWEIFAIPGDGWSSDPNRIVFRLGIVGVALLLLLPLIWAGRLMSDRQAKEEALRERELQLANVSQRLKLALETSGVGVWELNVSQNVLHWDARMRAIYSVPAGQQEVSHEDWASALHPDDFERAVDSFQETIAGRADYVTGFRIVRPTGEVRHIRAVGGLHIGADGSRRIIGVNWDITEDVELQEQLRLAKSRTELQNRNLTKAKSDMEYAALHDALTGLANRRYVDQILEDYPVGVHMTILHIDLDRFKEINDTFGHAAGDMILNAAAQALRDHVYEGDFLARIGGDEFVVISDPQNANLDYASLAAKLVEVMSRPLHYEGHECRVGASVGFAVCNTAEEKPSQLLINADIALYEAKRKGRNRVEPFTERLRHVAKSNKRTADDILRGLEQGQFIAYYQPQFDANTLEVNGFEALVRWDHPTKGIVAPDAFLRIAESLKVVGAIDARVLDQAHLHFTRLQANGIDIPKFSVNLSAQRLKEEDLYSKIKQMGLKPGTLSVELLESISFEGDDRELLRQIDGLKDMGIDIEIDDFGTGHASILTLLKLMPSRLKIDRQLVFPITKSAPDRALVSSIIEIGRSLFIHMGIIPRRYFVEMRICG